MEKDDKRESLMYMHCHDCFEKNDLLRFRVLVFSKVCHRIIHDNLEEVRQGEASLDGVAQRIEFLPSSTNDDWCTHASIDQRIHVIDRYGTPHRTSQHCENAGGLREGVPQRSDLDPSRAEEG